MNLHETLSRCARAIFDPRVAEPNRDPGPEFLAECRRRIGEAHHAVLEPRFAAALEPDLDATRRQALYDRFAAAAPARSLDPDELADRFLAWLCVESGLELSLRRQAALRSALDAPPVDSGSDEDRACSAS